MSDTPSAFFSHDHRSCDDLWSRVEAAADAGDAGATSAAWGAFAAAMERHFRWEEEVLFPAIDAVAGFGGGGPIYVMKLEHEQMRGVLGVMTQAAAAGQWEDVVDHGDTLLMLVQQHNAKEENVLYPMADRFVGDQWAELRSRLDG